jgi:hypothetical protein
VRRARLVSTIGLLSLFVGACATGEVSMLATVAGGEKIRVPLGRGGAALTNEGGVQVDVANFTMTSDNKLVYAFAFTDSRKRPLRRVLVEDVSDETPKMLVDSADALSATGQWRGASEPLGATDPRLQWIATLPNSLRVFRFTVTFADGKNLVLHQGMFCPAPIKSSVRHSFGQNY